jgi:hypothetical protein
MASKLSLIDLVEAGKVPLKALVRQYALTREVHIARYNGWSWVVLNPYDFKKVQIAEEEIERICQANPKFIHEKNIK